MRKECQLALTARLNGILLMDSIELQEAHNEVSRADSIYTANRNSITQKQLEDACRKAHFYEQKLQHDKKDNQQSVKQ